jgi:hypothetical protein
MIRLTIDRVVVEGLPSLNRRDFHKHLERELSEALGARPQIAGRRSHASQAISAEPVHATDDSRALARELAQSLVEALNGG